MKTSVLVLKAITRFLIGAISVGFLIFLPAGTLSFFNGWILMCILFVPMLVAGAYLMLKNPELLSKRLVAKEK